MESYWPAPALLEAYVARGTYYYFLSGLLLPRSSIGFPFRTWFCPGFGEYSGKGESCGVPSPPAAGTHER